MPSGPISIIVLVGSVVITALGLLLLSRIVMVSASSKQGIRLWIDELVVAAFPVGLNFLAGCLMVELFDSLRWTDERTYGIPAAISTQLGIATGLAVLIFRYRQRTRRD